MFTITTQTETYIAAAADAAADAVAVHQLSYTHTHVVFHVFEQFAAAAAAYLLIPLRSVVALFLVSWPFCTKQEKENSGCAFTLNRSAVWSCNGPRACNVH